MVSIRTATLPRQLTVDHPNPHRQQPALGIIDNRGNTALLGSKVMNPPPREALLPALSQLRAHRREQLVKIKSHSHADIQPHQRLQGFLP